MRLAVGLALVLLSGCVAPPPPGGDPALAAAAPQEPGPAGEPDASPAAPRSSTSEDGAVRTIANASSFQWQSARRYGDLALALHVAPVGEETHCAFHAAMGYEGAPAGFAFLAFGVMDGRLAGAGGGGGGAPVAGHALGVSSRSIEGEGSGAVGVGWGRTLGASGIDIILAGVSTAPADADFVANGSVLVNVTCDDPIVLSDFAFSREVALYRTGYGASGAGATVLFAAGAGAQETVGLDAASPRVVAALVAGGVGQARIDAPEGTSTALSTPLGHARMHADGGPGPWAIGVDAMAGTFSAFGGIVGLAPIPSWDAIPAS